VKTVKTEKGTELPLISLKGKDYLQVMHRMVWFREECPNYGIETSFIALDDQVAIAKAIITNETGKILSTAHKREDKGHFADHMEKAETGAIGRALANIGYGTQFTDDLDEGARIVDSPAPPKQMFTEQRKLVAGIPVNPIPQQRQIFKKAGHEL